MPGTPRDLLKTHTQKRGEVLSLNALKAGQANSQAIISGCVVTPKSGTTDHLAITAGEVLLGQQIVAYAGSTDVTPGSWSTSAGEFRKVVGELDASGTLSWLVGDIAGSQAAAQVPALTPEKIAIVILEIPASFTADTTAFTSSMIKQALYDNGSN